MLLQTSVSNMRLYAPLSQPGMRLRFPWGEAFGGSRETKIIPSFIKISVSEICHVLDTEETRHGMNSPHRGSAGRGRLHLGGARDVEERMTSEGFESLNSGRREILSSWRQKPNLNHLGD